MALTLILRGGTVFDGTGRAPVVADVAVEEAWRQEIRRRVAAYERGEAVLHDADDVMAEAKRIAP